MNIGMNKQMKVPGLTRCPSCDDNSVSTIGKTDLTATKSCNVCHKKWIYGYQTGIVQYLPKDEPAARAYVATVTILVVAPTQQYAHDAIKEALASHAPLDWGYACINDRILVPEPREWDAEWTAEGALEDIDPVTYSDERGWLVDGWLKDEKSI